MTVRGNVDSRARHHPDLSPIEVETWLLYAQGVAMKAIAVEHKKHVATVEARLWRVRNALGVESRFGLIKAAVEHGLIEHGEMPKGKPGYCPCCGYKLPHTTMRALVMFWHGRGYLEVAKALRIRPQTLTYHLEKLKRIYGGRGVQHYLACAVRSGLMRKLLNELGTPAARAVADGRRHADGPHLGRPEVRHRGHVPDARSAVRAESAA